MPDVSALWRESDDEVPARVRFQDARGVYWTVWERDTRMDPGHRAATCLVFENEATVRRVWSYPANWHRMSPAELAALGSTT